MADIEAGETLALDENSEGLIAVIRAARAVGYKRTHLLPELGIRRGTLDPDLLAELGKRGVRALVARDGKMLDPVIQRGAWREAGITLFLLGTKWGGLPLGELARRFLFLWPTIVDYTDKGGIGAAWRVSPSVPEVTDRAFRLVTGRHADPAAG